MQNNIINKLFILILTGSTLVTSAAAGVKIANSFQPVTPQVSGISIASAANQETSSTLVSPSPVSTKSPKSNTKIPSLPTPTLKIFPTSPLPSPAPTSAPTANSSGNCAPAANLCIVTLFGQQYNVTSLRSSHAGGDIFVCGTDMSSRYQSAHGSNMSRMQAYLYTPSSNSASCSPGSSSTPAPTNRPVYQKLEDEEDEDDDRYEERHDEDDDEDDHEENETED